MEALIKRAVGFAAFISDDHDSDNILATSRYQNSARTVRSRLGFTRIHSRRQSFLPRHCHAQQQTSPNVLIPISTQAIDFFFHLILPLNRRTIT